MKKIKALIAVVSSAVPMFVFAQVNNASYITTAITSLRRILNAIIPLLVTVAIIVFFWELIMFIKAKKDGADEKAKNAKAGLWWALVALFLMFSFMGIVRIMQGITGTGGQNVINQYDLPQVAI